MGKYKISQNVKTKINSLFSEEDEYGFFNKKKERSLTEKIRQMKGRVGTGLGNEPVSFVDKIKELTKRRDSLRASLFSEKENLTEDDKYSFGGSPGMSSVGAGALGGNTNRGLTSIGPNFTKERLDKIKQNLKMDKSSEDSYMDIENLGDINKSMKSWFKRRDSKLFKNTPPKGLAEKVKLHLSNKK